MARGRHSVERKGDCGKRTRELLARHYLTLMGEFRRTDGRLLLSMDGGDVFHTAIALILQDDAFRSLGTDEAIMERVRRRIRNVATEIEKDNRKRREVPHADDIQAGTEE